MKKNNILGVVAFMLIITMGPALSAEIWENGSRIGIGTKSPKGLLTIHDGNEKYLYPALLVKIKDNQSTVLGSNDSNSIVFQTEDDATNMTLRFAASHSQKASSISASGMTNYRGFSGNLLLQATGGKVGVGISSPSSTLHILDKGKARSTVTIENKYETQDTRDYAQLRIQSRNTSGTLSSYPTDSKNEKRKGKFVISSEYSHNRGLLLASGGKDRDIEFRANEGSRDTPDLIIKDYGRVGVGTTFARGKLTVWGGDETHTWPALAVRFKDSKDLVLGSNDSVTMYFKTIPEDRSDFGLTMGASYSKEKFFFQTTRTVNDRGRGGDTLLLQPSNGQVSIGGEHVNKEYKLTVNGGIIAKRVTVQPDNWPDYVFEESYHLMPLKELTTFIKKNKHLPGISPQSEVMEKGADIGTVQVKLLEKIEELTLYIIELNDKVSMLDAQNKYLEAELNALKESTGKSKHFAGVVK